MKTSRRIQKALDIINNQQNACINPAHNGDMTYINALNSIFGSNTDILRFRDKDDQMIFKSMFLSSLAHRTKSKNVEDGTIQVLLTERWLLSDEEAFVKTRAKEIRILEDVLMGIMLYLLGGFTFPDDSMREGPLRHMEVDMSEIIAEPRKSFVLLNIDPAYMLLYMMWKIECLTHALGREFMFMEQTDTSVKLMNILKAKVEEFDNKCIEYRDSRKI